MNKKIVHYGTTYDEDISGTNNDGICISCDALVGRSPDGLGEEEETGYEEEEGDEKNDEEVCEAGYGCAEASAHERGLEGGSRGSTLESRLKARASPPQLHVSDSEVKSFAVHVTSCLNTERNLNQLGACGWFLTFYKATYI